MDFVVNTNFVRQMLRLLDRSKPTQAAVEHRMEKPLCPVREEEEQPFPRTSPEAKGVSSRRLASFLSEVAADRTLDIHGILIVKDGAVICDAPFGAYDGGYYHACHSLSKTVTATAIGMLISEGKLSLDDRVVKLLEKKIPPLSQLTYKNLTVRHLLTMSAGSSFSEAGVTVEKHWLRAYFESLPRFEPGKNFQYNSLNSYVLACIVREVSGKTLTEYLRPRLFAPLGISVFHWERSPEGVEVGGWGLYLRREDMAKLGQLYLDGGVWRGKRILAEGWVKQATKSHIATPETIGAFDYGYHLWVGREENCFLFNGMFCQDVLVFPKTRTIIVTNGGIEQLFQQSRYYELLFRYFGADDYGGGCTKRDPFGEKRLRRLCRSLCADTVGEKGRAPCRRMPRPLSQILDVPFRAPERDPKSVLFLDGVTGTGSVSLLPFVEQVLRNRFGKGLRSMTFRCVRGRLSLEVTEGNEVHILPIDFTKTVKTVCRLSDTDYHVAVTAKAATDERGRGVILLRLSFPEVASSRLIGLYLSADALEVRMSESPGLGLTALFFDSVEQYLQGKKGIAGVVSILDRDAFYCKLEKTLEPSFTLYADPQR